jgi:predicted nuclease of restriction endonuclease-like RecB superfamily
MSKKSKRSKKTKSKSVKISRYTKEWNKKYGEKSVSLEKKSKISGVPLSILKKVYNKGLAAWRGGSHRPGASHHQWGVSRVNSFLTCGKTWYFPDHKLAKEAMKKSPKARKFWSKKKCVKSKMGKRTKSR